MEPRIQYAQSFDGTNIAFFSIGEGPPLVHMPIAFSHIQMEWEMDEIRRWYEALAASHQLVRFDSRGYGLSDRDVEDVSYQAEAADVGAVAAKLDLERYAVFAAGIEGPAAIMHAASNPQAVSHLILMNSIIRGEDADVPSQPKSARSLMDVDWELYTETAASTAFGWGSGDAAHRYAAIIRAVVDADTVRRVGAEVFKGDVDGLLPSISMPTLILYRPNAAYPSADVQRRLASRIPDATLQVVSGGSFMPYVGDMEAPLSSICAFLGTQASIAESGEKPDIQTILFTDVAGSTALTQRLGDEKARYLLREHERITRRALTAHGGSEVKTMGDGFMASFGSASKALECAIELQKSFAEYSASGEETINVRIGMNAGEPLAEVDPGGRGDLFGTAVNMAARIASKAEGGEILVSDVVRQLVAGKNFLFSDRGEAELRGFEDAVRLFEVRWRE